MRRKREKVGGYTGTSVKKESATTEMLTFSLSEFETAATGWTMSSIAGNVRYFALAHYTQIGPASIQSPTEWIPGARSLRIKRCKAETDHVRQSNAEVQDAPVLPRYTHTHIWLHRMVLKLSRTCGDKQCRPIREVGSRLTSNFDHPVSITRLTPFILVGLLEILSPYTYKIVSPLKPLCKNNTYQLLVYKKKFQTPSYISLVYEVVLFKRLEKIINKIRNVCAL